MVGERNGLRIGLEAHLEAALRPNRHNARRAKLVRPTFGRSGRAQSGQQRHQRPGDPH